MAKGGGTLCNVEKRVAAEVSGALKRKPPAEARLAGALRALLPSSAPLRTMAADALAVLVRRQSYDRPLYGAVVRALAEANDRRIGPLLKSAIADEGGGLAALSAACHARDPSLSPPLLRAATSRHAHFAFAAEVARLARGENTSAHLMSLAPKIKESHRIALCVEVFVPLVRAEPLPPGIAPALGVLRESERHLGRWLVLAEVAARAGDDAPRQQALRAAEQGPESSRAAWAMVGWALGGGTPPGSRPNVETVARLSDRPSSDRDTSFLFRLAEARAPCCRPMLELLAKAEPGDAVALRAARSLARDFGRGEALESLRKVAADRNREELRGLAVASLWDAGDRAHAAERAAELADARALCTQTWAALVLHARDVNGPADIVDEARFRRIQLGWIE